jgi:hypothetical protein
VIAAAMSTTDATINERSLRDVDAFALLADRCAVQLYRYTQRRPGQPPQPTRRRMTPP